MTSTKGMGIDASKAQQVPDAYAHVPRPVRAPRRKPQKYHKWSSRKPLLRTRVGIVAVAGLFFAVPVWPVGLTLSIIAARDARGSGGDAAFVARIGLLLSSAVGATIITLLIIGAGRS